MKEDKLSDLSMQLSVDVLKLTKELKAKHETIISNQIGRSATSVCANIAESKYGHSRADFIAKLEIALKEANETGKWLEMLFKSEYIDEATYKSIAKTCSTIRILLIASIKTAKSKLNKQSWNGDDMKMWKSKSWQLEATGVDGNVKLFGVNIFDYDWVDTKNKIAVKDLSYAVPVYSVIIDGKEYEFAAGERSNCVWDFYLYKF